MTTRHQEILEEHAAIRSTILRIQSELDRLRAAPVQPEEAWELPGLVASFRDRLRRHFELEEGGGLLGDAMEYYDPEMQVEASELIAEHRGFERAIDRICTELGQGSVPPDAAQSSFDGDLRRLIADLTRHEATEKGLLTRLVSRGADGDDQPPADPSGLSPR